MASPSETKPVNVLVVEAPGKQDSLSIIQTLENMEARMVEVSQADSLKQAFERLDQKTFQVILLDLFLPDSQGLASLTQLMARAPELPVLVISPTDDRQLALDSLREGAQDFLISGEITPGQLHRAISFAVERQRNRAMLQQLSFNDELTGLLNRRGFLSLAQQQIKIARRENWELVLLFADLDGLKNINDKFGHPQGDHALRSVGAILKETFRASDLVARLGGDEFVVLAIHAPSSGVRAITSRLKRNVDLHNQQNQDYQIALSFGIAQFDPHQDNSLEDVILRADQALYENKRSKMTAAEAEDS